MEEQRKLEIFQNLDFEQVGNIESNLFQFRLKDKNFLLIDIAAPEASENVKLDFLGIISCKTGMLTVMFDASHVYTVKPGQMLFLPIGRSFNISVSANCTGTLLCVRHSMIFKTFRLDSNFRNIFQILKSNPVVDLPYDKEFVGSALFTLLDNLKGQESQAFYPEMLQSIFQFILYGIMSLAESRTQIKKAVVISHREVLFNNFLLELGSNMPVEREVAFYADKLCVTPKYLSSICKIYGGKNASDFITSFATEEIRNMLEFSTLSIKEISIKLKFPSISFFGRYVKKNLGLSPTEYRKSLH